VNTIRGSATRSAGLITVTGLAPGESAVVTVGATRTGYNAGTAVVSGNAATAVAVPWLPVWGVAALSGMLMILVKKLNKKNQWAGSRKPASVDLKLAVGTACVGY